MKDSLFFKERSILSFLIFLKPIQTAPIRQMFYLEMFKCSLEAITVGACSHHPHHHGCIVLQPAVTHHRVFLVIERVEYLNRIEPAHRLNPNKIHRLIKFYYTPVTTEQPAMIMDSLTGKAVLLNKVDAKQILSNREKEILRMIDAGMSSKEIAAMLNISIYTVSRHRQNILEKLHAKNSSHACTRAKNLKLI